MNLLMAEKYISGVYVYLCMYFKLIHRQQRATLYEYIGIYLFNCVFIFVALGVIVRSNMWPKFGFCTILECWMHLAVSHTAFGYLFTEKQFSQIDRAKFGHIQKTVFLRTTCSMTNRTPSFLLIILFFSIICYSYCDLDLITNSHHNSIVCTRIYNECVHEHKWLKTQSTQTVALFDNCFAS